MLRTLHRQGTLIVRTVTRKMLILNQASFGTDKGVPRQRTTAQKNWGKSKVRQSKIENGNGLAQPDDAGKTRAWPRELGTANEGIEVFEKGVNAMSRFAPAKRRLAEQKKYRHLRGRAVLWVVSIDGDVVPAQRPAGDARKPTREIHNTALIVSLNFILGKNQRADGIAHRRGEVVRRAGIGVRDVRRVRISFRRGTGSSFSRRAAAAGSPVLRRLEHSIYRVPPRLERLYRVQGLWRTYALNCPASPPRLGFEPGGRGTNATTR